MSKTPTDTSPPRNILQFNKPAPAPIPETEEVNIYGCQECGGTEFHLMVSGAIACCECDTYVKLMVLKYPEWIESLMEDFKESLDGS